MFHIELGHAVLAHRFSWEIANGIEAGSAVIRHTCDNTLCVNPDHLLAGTQADNVADKVARGRCNPARGERTRHSKLTASAVQSIRNDFTGRRGERLELAKKYGVKATAISNIVNRKTWRHVL